MRRISLVFVFVALASFDALAGTVAGPDMHYADADGQYLGIFRDAVDSDTGVVLYHVTIPVGATKVPTAPPNPDTKWNAADAAWAVDPDYVEPEPEREPIDGLAILNLLVQRGVITEADKNGLLTR